MIRPLGSASALAFAVLTTTGCTIDTEPMFTSYGTANLSWALAGRVDPDVCGERQASFVQIVLQDHQGKPVTSTESACDGFTWESRLAAKFYTAQFTLLDEEHEPLGRPRMLAFVVGPGQKTSVGVDLVTGKIDF